MRLLKLIRFVSSEVRLTLMGSFKGISDIKKGSMVIFIQYNLKGSELLPISAVAIFFHYAVKNRSVFHQSPSLLLKLVKLHFFSV